MAGTISLLQAVALLGNIASAMTVDSTAITFIKNAVFQNKGQFNASRGEIKNVTAALTTVGAVVQTAQAGAVGTDGAFITFVNKDASKSFALGMDKDGEFKVGGGSMGVNAYKVWHDNYHPGAMSAPASGYIPWTDADLDRPTGTYRLNASDGQSSYALIEFNNIGGSTPRVQLMAQYGGINSAPDELFFRNARDSSTQFDGQAINANRIWHSGNITPLTNSSSIQLTQGMTLLNRAPTASPAEAWFSTPAYGTGQGDNRTHFGYNAGGAFVNYIRGANTLIESPLTARSEIYFVATTDTDSGTNPGTTWQLGKGTWAGSQAASTNRTSSSGIMSIPPGGLAHSTLFTFANAFAQCSVQMDGSLFVGESIPFNPFSIDCSTAGGMLVQNYAAFGSDVAVNGTLRTSKQVEMLSRVQTPGASFSINLATDPAIKYVISANQNFQISVSNVWTTDDAVTSITVIVGQGATGYIPTSFLVNGTAVTIEWAGGTAPVPSINRRDVFSFNIVRLPGLLYVLGTHTPFG